MFYEDENVAVWIWATAFLGEILFSGHTLLKLIKFLSSRPCRFFELQTDNFCRLPL